MNFKRQVFFSSLWSMAGSSGQQLIGFFIFIYIARQLTPADVGLVALAMVLVEIFGFMSRIGQVEVLQRLPDLPERTTDTSFWLLVVSGVSFTLIILGGANFARLVSDNAAFPLVLGLLAPICLLQALNATPEALLKRRFDFRSLSLRNWAAALTGGLLGIWLAYRGFGVFALVAQRLGTAVVQTAASWLFLRWHPRFNFDWPEARRLAGIGVEIMLAGFAGVLNMRLADAVAGATIGPSALGYLRLGWRFYDVLVGVSANPIVNVALATFSQLQQDAGALRRAYLRLTQFMASASLPMFFGLGAIADVLVPVVFGQKWLDSVIVLQLLGFVVLGSTVNNFFAPVMIAVGKSRVLLRQSVFQLIVTLVLVYIGSFFGLAGVMVAFIGRGLLVAAYNLRALETVIGLEIGSLLKVLIPPTLSSATMVGAVALAKAEIGHALPDLLLLAVLVIIGAGTYALALVAGDLAGVWRGYVRDAIASLAGAVTRRARATATPA